MGKPEFMATLSFRHTLKGFKERRGMMKIPL